MQKDRWEKIEEIFNKAVEYQGGERNTYLADACAGDRSMFLEVTDLLTEHEIPTLSLDEPVLKVGLRLLDEPESGQRTGEIIGRFKIGRLIGRGGMGDVYEADDPNLGFKVAVKLVNESFASDPERIRRFRKEAKLASLVSHPNVAKLFEFCEIDGENLIIMELVEGENLRHQLTDAIPPDRALDIAIQISKALAAAHAVGVIHRDIKPENIIITPGGSVKVLDFGLAKLVSLIDDSPADTQGHRARETANMSTEYGTFIGTPAYMSPEQIRGTDVDTRTDIWSLGVVLYEMLSGQLPFHNKSKIDVIAAILILEPVPIQNADIPFRDKINAVLSRTLAKENTDRHRTADELLTELEEIRQSFETEANTQIKRQDFWSRPIWTYAAGLIILSSLIVAGIVASRRQIESSFSTPVIAPPLGRMPITNGLVSYWSADGNTNDTVGGNNGELLNGAMHRPGVYGQAFSFDGVDAFFKAPTNGFPTGNGDRALAMWVKVDEYVAEETLFAGYGRPPNGEAFLIGTTERHLFVSNWGANVASVSLEVGRWYYIAATSKAISPEMSSVSLYLDGEFRNESILKIDTRSGTEFYSGRLPFGEPDDGIRRLRGAVDEIVIYDRALSADEIHALYLEQKPSESSP